MANWWSIPQVWAWIKWRVRDSWTAMVRTRILTSGPPI
jgi:hypothetical protein